VYKEYCKHYRLETSVYKEYCKHYRLETSVYKEYCKHAHMVVVTCEYSVDVQSVVYAFR